MRRLHVVSDRCRYNGIFVAARLIAEHEGSSLVTCAELASIADLSVFDEIVVHGCWLPCLWGACLRTIRAGKPRLVRMTHASLDPVRLAYHGWKKRLVWFIERWLFRHAVRVVATCAAEAGWNRALLGDELKVETVDLRGLFEFRPQEGDLSGGKKAGPWHVLYLGRRHPLKGVRYLEAAVRELGSQKVELRVVSEHAGGELESDWTWCDVLCLPTLSENFGLVVAEALERGKRIITTDGAPVWEGQPGVVYVRGFRDGDDVRRVALLKEALGGMGKGK